MIKKLIIVFALVLLSIGTNTVKAKSIQDEIDAEEKSLQPLIQVCQDGIWNNLIVEMYNEDNMIIYELGNKHIPEKEIIVTQNCNSNKQIPLLRIIKNGYKAKTPNQLGVYNEGDAYMATKIAIDCLNNDYTPENFSDYYKEIDGLDAKSSSRAKCILKLASNLLYLGYNGTENYGRVIGIDKVGELQKDGDYYSQTYRINVEPFEQLIGYTVTETSDTQTEYVLMDANGVVKNKDDLFSTSMFKVMIPNNNQNEEFNIDFSVDFLLLSNHLYTGVSSQSEYIIQCEARDICGLGINLSGTIEIENPDENPGENPDENPDENPSENPDENPSENPGENPGENPDENPGENPDENPGENPDENTSEKPSENPDETVKQGSLLVITNAEESTYKIYDKNGEVIGTYVAENGKVYIEKINEGKYVLKQISVSEGYKITGDINFDIMSNNETRLFAVNEKIEKVVQIIGKEDESEKREPQDNIDNLPEKEEKQPEEVNENDKLDNVENKKQETDEKINQVSNIQSDKDKFYSNNVLPRTGNDYLYLKLILIDSCIFILFLIKLKKKAQTTKLSSLYIQKIKE